jgi:hypothetical protein
LLLVDRRAGPNCSIWLVAVALGAAACGAPAPPQPTPSTTAQQVNPARIDRVRGALPSGYETADLTGPASPAAVWGYGADWRADPPRCAALADPAGAAKSAGWSASGPGGIVYAVVASASVDVDTAVLRECGRWTVEGGQTTGTVTLGPAPAVDSASTLAMATASTTVVEGGTQTRSHADTVTAYLGDHVAFVSVVTDPGSPNPQLGADLASDLLAETVSALRG